jgi:hypothetical protein
MNTRKILSRCTLLVAGLCVAGCTTTYQARKVETGRFLRDYSMMKKGSAETAQLVYMNPKANWKKYKKVLLEPVGMYAKADSALAKMPQEDMLALVSYFGSAIRGALKDDYELVEKAGPDVLRIRVAVTDAKGSNVLLDTTTNIMPPMLVLSALKRVATGSNIAVGKAQVEMEVLDSMTGVRLAARVDKRVGRKTFKGKFGKWNDSQAAFDYWAKKLKDRLSELRSE